MNRGASCVAEAFEKSHVFEHTGTRRCSDERIVQISEKIPFECKADYSPFKVWTARFL